MKKYEGQPDIIRKAKYFPQLEVDGQTRMYTKIHDEEDRVFRFEDGSGTTVEHQMTVDDGTLKLSEDQVKEGFEGKLIQNLCALTVAPCSVFDSASFCRTLGPSGGKPHPKMIRRS